MNRMQGSIGPAAAACALVAALGGCQNPQAVGSVAAPGLDASPAAVQTMEGALIASFAACKGERHLRTRYVPQIKITLGRDGAFEAPPVLVNPSSRRADRRVAEAALAAVNRCAPVSVVRAYQPYYQYWHEYVLDFAPG